MSTYDFAHVDFSNTEISESLGRAFTILLERVLSRQKLEPDIAKASDTQSSAKSIDSLDTEDIYPPAG